MFRQALSANARIGGQQALTDAQQLRQFLTGPGLFAFFDAPWAPIYIALLFAFHPWFGWVAMVSVVVLLVLATTNERVTGQDLHEANQRFLEASQFAQANLRNAEVIAGLGMLSRLRDRWVGIQESMLASQSRASTRAALIASLTRTFRIAVQSLVLGLGAYLTIEREVTAGHIFAASLVLGRALAPLDQMIASWRGFAAAREGYRRLSDLLTQHPAPAEPMPLPSPQGRVSVESLVIATPNAAEPIIKGVSIEIEPGELIAVIGPSGSGKSTLARALLGLRPATRGAVRLDGADVQQWDRTLLGTHVGYLPQDVELLDGTVGENIARFTDVDPDKVIAAATLAGIHDFVLRLAQGYDTRLGNGATQLSAGQLQRLGIARALYGLPSLVVLDEPNSNLDQAGDQALLSALEQLRSARRTVVIVTHRSNVLEIADRVLMLFDGRVAFYLPREEARAELRRRQSQMSNVSKLRPLS
jgi:ATP-binding cassette subfamily C protein EexD